MAHETLALHHSPDFHTVFTQAIHAQIEHVCQVVDSAMRPPTEVKIQDLVRSIDLQLARVENLKAWASVEQIRALLAPMYSAENLPVCSYESAETSHAACDGQPCAEAGTVHSLMDDMPHCCKHFALAVHRG